MKQLYKKQYRIEIELFASPVRRLFAMGGKKLQFTFPSATLRQLIDLSNGIEDDKDLNDFMFRFLNQHGKISKRQFSMMKWDQIKNILEFIIKTYGKGYMTMSDESKKVKSKSPASSLIMMIIEKSNETMESLLDLQWSTIEFMIDGIIWNMNETTKEGKQKNMYQMNLKEQREEQDDETALKKIKEMEERMKNNNINFQKDGVK